MDEKEATVFATLAIQFVWCCGSVICPYRTFFFFFFAPRRNLGESLDVSIWPFCCGGSSRSKFYYVTFHLHIFFVLPAMHSLFHHCVQYLCNLQEHHLCDRQLATLANISRC